MRMIIFLIAALLAGLAGWLYAHMLRFISPSPFDIRRSIEYLLMAMAGGAASIYGAVVGSALVVFLKNGLQDVSALFFEEMPPARRSSAFSVLLILLLQTAAGAMSLIQRLVPRNRALPVAAAEGLDHRAMPATGTELLRVEGVTRRFGGLVAVNNVSFEMKAGEILGLIGPNGAGKSTLFNLVTGALEINGGRIVFMGRDVSNAPQTEIARAGTGAPSSMSSCARHDPGG